MDFVQEQAGDAVIVRLTGRLDGTVAKSVEDRFERLLTDGGSPYIAIDMAGVEYISSAGLRVLLLVGKKLQQAKGKLTLFDCIPHVYDVFSMSGFDRMVPIHSGSAAAIAALR